MSDINVWEKYEKIKKLGVSSFECVYKGKNKEKGNYVIIKEIEKKTIREYYNISEHEFMNIINKENLISIIEIINSKDYYYIVMELCLINLEEYMKIRDKGLSIEELREFLIEINKTLKSKEIIYRDLKLTNILISLNTINKISIKISDLGLNKKMNEEITMSSFKIPYTRSPEIIENADIDIKSDLWNLGIIIYYLLFKEYPFKGNNEFQLLKDIKSKKILKLSEDNNLNDLMNRMICIDLNKRISWEDYFNHSFFNKYPQFEFKCKNHSKINEGYCLKCKKNICEECLNEHLNDDIIPLNKIGMNEKEKIKIENLIKEIEINIDKMKKMKEDITLFINKIKNINENTNIYENDDKNNFKEYYIKYLEIIKDKSKIEGNINNDLYKKEFWIFENKIIEIEL